MTLSLELTRPSNVTPSLQANPQDVPRTKRGEIKRRLSWEDKLHILDPTSSVEDTKARLREFRRLFAYRYGGAIITRVHGGPRAWTALRGGIYTGHLVRHLLADRIPTLPPQWVGARSWQTTQFFAIDVDADRTPEQGVEDNFDLSSLDEQEREHYRAWLQHQTKPAKAKPPFESRCRYVEDVLRWVGVDPEDPFQVLIQPTPSGGRHYYVFLDAPYSIFQVEAMFRCVGFKHTPGQHELFPSTGRGLRLPFGHVPGQPHDPRAWIRFIDHYRFGRIRRFSIKEMYDNLEGRQRTPAPKPRPRPGPTHTPVLGEPLVAGIPKRYRLSIERYNQLVHLGPKTTKEARELLDLGIRLPATRTEALKHVAAHLVWFRGMSADEAAEELTTWAYDLRHDSEDIRDDFQKGTRNVAKQIVAMCRWYAAHMKPRSTTEKPLFAAVELMSLRPHLQPLTPEERVNHAHFLLSFLRFAKLHGKPADDNSAWEAAPAINAVVKKWEACRHGNTYRKRIEHAEGAGILTMIREKWQNHRGPGRARTYRLAVPVVPREEWCLDYESALDLLTSETPTDIQQIQTDEYRASISPNGTEEKDANDERTRRIHIDDQARATDYPALVHPACTRTDLEQGPRECPEKPVEAVGLPRQADGAVRTVPTAAAGQAIPQGGKRPAGVKTPSQPLFMTEEIQRRREENQAAIRELLEDPELPPPLRRILTTDPERLSEMEVRARISVVFQRRRERAAKGRGQGLLPTCIIPKRERLAIQAEERLRDGSPVWDAVSRSQRVDRRQHS